MDIQECCLYLDLTLHWVRSPQTSYKVIVMLWRLPLNCFSRVYIKKPLSVRHTLKSYFTKEQANVSG